MKFDPAIRIVRLVAMAVILGAALASQVSADVTITENEGEYKLSIVQMTVTPAAAPVPALRHRLVARDLDVKPGNAAPFYYRAFMEVPRTHDALKKEFGEDWHQWYRTGATAESIANIPLDKLRKAVKIASGPIDDQLARAVSLQDCDWQLGERSLTGPEAVAFLLPEMSDSRALARFLAMRTRLAIAEGRTDDAITSMRMTYRLASDTAKPPMLVCGLVGIGAAGTANGTLLELISTRNSPNMYWALAELPQPLVDLRPGARFEMGFAKRMFPFLRQAETADHSPEEWNQLYKRAFRDFLEIAHNPNDSPVRDEVAATMLAVIGYPRAKARLIEKGMDRDRVEKMAVGQVMAIYTSQICDQLSDDYEKLWYVPFWEMRARFPEIEQKLAAAQLLQGGPNREVFPIMALLLPSVQQARESQVLLDREVAALRVIEAVRMFAATHERRLPTTLSQITEVPIPLNPATGQAFAYRLDGNTAILELPASDGIRNQNRRYEIRITSAND